MIPGELNQAHEKNIGPFFRICFLKFLYKPFQYRMLSHANRPELFPARRVARRTDFHTVGGHLARHPPVGKQQTGKVLGSTLYPKCFRVALAYRVVSPKGLPTSRDAVR